MDIYNILDSPQQSRYTVAKSRSSSNNSYNMVGPLIGAFASFANSAMQNATNSSSIRNQNALWQKQKEYQNFLNANGMLVHRNALAKAGLNPNYEFGPSENLTAGTPNQASLVSPNIDVGSLLQSQLIDSQRRNIDADTDKKLAETGVANADEVLKQAQAWSIEELTPAQRKEIEQNTSKMVEEIENLKVDRALVDATIGKVLAETAGQELQNYLIQETTPLIIQQYTTNIALLNAQKKLTDAQTAAAFKSIQVMCAQINSLNAQANYNNAQAKYVATAMIGLAIDNDIKKYRSAFTSDFVHNELKMSEVQIKHAENSAEQIRTSTEFAPLQAIAGAGGSLGVAFGGVATGLNQGMQFFNQRPARPIGFNR